MPYHETPTGAFETHPSPVWPTQRYPLDVALTDEQYVDLLDNYGAYPEWALDALDRIGTRSVVVTFLVAGTGYVDGDADHKSMYWLGARMQTAGTRNRLQAIVAPTGSQRGQIALANQIVPPHRHERRDRILAWSFRPV